MSTIIFTPDHIVVLYIESNACDSDPCLNGGTCTSSDDNTYNCSCGLGFSGSRCEIGNELSVLHSPPCELGTINLFKCNSVAVVQYKYLN